MGEGRGNHVVGRAVAGPGRQGGKRKQVYIISVVIVTFCAVFKVLVLL